MPDDNLEIVRRGWDAWIAGDLPGVLQVYDDDMVWDFTHYPDMPEIEFRGIDAIKRYFDDFLAVFADYDISIDDMFAAPDGRIVTFYTQRGKGRVSGLAMEIHAAHVATVREGKITRIEIYEHRAEALAAVGLGDNVEILRQGWDAWIRGDLAGLYRFYDDDVVWDLTHFADWPEDVYRGVEAIDRFFRDWLAIWDEYEVGVDDILAAPDGRVVILYWHRGKGRHSGLPMQWESAQVATVRDGRITRMDLYDDRNAALAAAGLSVEA